MKNIDKARKRFEALGYVFEPAVRDDARGILIAFGGLDGYRIELVAPAEAGKASPVDGVLERSGSIPYHICYRSQELETDVEMLRKEGFKVTVPASAAAAFEGRRVVFMYSLAVGLIELVEERLPGG